MEDDSSLKRFAKVSRMFKKDGKKKMMNKEEDFQGLQRLGIKRGLFPKDGKRK